MVNCCVVGCKSRSTNKKEKASFYRIPCTPKVTNTKYHGPNKENMNSNMKLVKLLTVRNKAWISALCRGSMNDKQLKNSRVCHKHFHSGKPADLTNVHHPDWAPCKSLGYSYGQKLKKEAALARHFRSSKRVRRFSCESVIVNDTTLDDNCNISNSEPTNPNTNVTEHQESTIHYSNVTSHSTQTELSMDDLSELFNKLNVSSSTNEQLIKKLATLELTRNAFIKDDAKTKYFTGLHSHELLFAIHDLVSPYLSATSSTALPTFQQLLITLMKLRLNLPLDYLSYRFGISVYTVGRYFRNTIHVLSSMFSSLLYWPERDCLHLAMPVAFDESFGKHITSIIDCFETFMQTPSGMRTSAECWSNYKHHKTVKNLIGIVPQGSISFISEGWGGRTSDKHLTNYCGFFHHINPEDYVMADRGFKMAEVFLEHHARLLIPASTAGKNQLYPEELESTRKIANLRINVERVIGSLRQKYPILSSTVPISMLKVDTNGISLFDEIVVVCCALFNICPAIVSLS